MKKYIITITCLIFSGIACLVYSMENTDMLMNTTNNPITITQSRYQNNSEYISRLTELLQNVDQWLFVCSPTQNRYIPDRYILNLSPLEKLIYDAENEREIKSIQDYVQVKKQKIEFQDKEEKELSYTMPTEISNWLYKNASYPKFFDFNSVTKCEGIIDYTNQAIINSPIENQYEYAKKVCIPLLEALHTGNITIAEEFVLENKPSQQIFVLKEIDEISKKIVQEDTEIFDQINRICLGNNTFYSYPENFTEKVGEFVDKYSELLQKSKNFLDCLLEKTKDLNSEENQRMRIKVSSQPAFCWPSIAIGPSAYFLHQSSREGGNFNVWTTLLAAGTLAWSGWKTYTYYKNHQRLTQNIHLQEKTNKLEGYLTSLQNKAKLGGENPQDEQHKQNTVNARQWPNVDSKIGQPLGLGCCAIPLIAGIPIIFKAVFKTGPQVGDANDKPAFDFWNNIASGLSFSAVSAWLWRQNKNKFEFDDAQNLFISCRNRGEANGFAKIQEFKKNRNADNNALLKLTSRNET